MMQLDSGIWVPDAFPTPAGTSFAAADTDTPVDDNRRSSAKKKIAGGLAVLYTVFGGVFFLALAFVAGVFGYVLLNIR